MVFALNTQFVSVLLSVVGSGGTLVRERVFVHTEVGRHPAHLYIVVMHEVLFGGKALVRRVFYSLGEYACIDGIAEFQPINAQIVVHILCNVKADEFSVVGFQVVEYHLFAVAHDELRKHPLHLRGLLLRCDGRQCHRLMDCLLLATLFRRLHLVASAAYESVERVDKRHLVQSDAHCTVVYVSVAQHGILHECYALHDGVDGL